MANRTPRQRPKNRPTHRPHTPSPAPHCLHDMLIDIYAENLRASPGDHCRCRQADIAKADDADGGGRVTVRPYRCARSGHVA